MAEAGTRLALVMQWARERQQRCSSVGIDTLLLSAIAAAWLGILLALAGGYHAGFSTLHALLGALLPDTVWATVTRFGDERVLLALTLLFARRRPELFWAMVLAAVLGALYSRGLKHLVDALRPPAVLPPEALKVIGPVLHSHSFPSGHTTSAFVFFGVLAACARSGRERVAALLAATLVGLSRVALGVHWPQDVLAGAYGGMLAAATGTWLSLHWRAGLRPGVHLALLLLPLGALPVLLLSDAGNPSADWLVWPLVFAMAAQFVLDYLSDRR